MISLSSVSRSPRNLVLFTITGIVLFLLFYASFEDGDHHISSWTGFNGVRTTDTDHNATLGVAKKIYVLSIPHRTDHRHEMEKLKKALGLRWSYVNAMDMGDRLIGRILDSVRRIRATSKGPFIWPAHMPPSNAYINPWSPEFPLSAKISDNNQSEPILCATKNDTVAPYEPNLPEFLIITPSRIASWYSHLSVIEKVANDRSLEYDDAVIVLEDDVDMERNIHERLRHVWTYLPKDWDIVYLGHCWSNETFYPALNAHDNATATYIHPSKTPACNHGYAMTRSGARQILMHLRYPPFAYSRSIDLAISWLVQSDRIKSFSIFPSIVGRRKTTNSDTMTGKGTDRVDHLADGMLVGMDRAAPK